MTRFLRSRVYRDSSGRWRWRIVAGNGRKVASSGEAFASKSNALRAQAHFLVAAADGRIVQWL